MVSQAQILLLACGISCGVALMLAHWGQHLRRVSRSEYDLKALQSSHVRPTPRLGSFALLAGLAVAHVLGPADPVLLALLLSSLPLLLAAWLEDLGMHQSVRRRMLASIAASVLALWILNVAISHIDVPLTDPLLALVPVSLLFTIFATVGLTQAFNLIDGLNGLCVAAALIALGAMYSLASVSGATQVHFAILCLAAVTLGFALINYPRGQLFLGDAGAYFLGFALAWIAITLLAANPELSPWAVLLVFFWPVADTLFAILRRWNSKARTYHADRLHFHHLVMRGVEIRILGRRDHRLSNPLATAILIPFMTAPAAVGVTFWNNALHASLATAGFGLAFVLSYKALLRLVVSKRRLVVPRSGREAGLASHTAGGGLDAG